MTKPHSLMGNSSSKVISPTPTPDAVPGDANSTNITLEKYQKEPKYHEQEVQSLLQPTDEDNECPEASSSSLSAMEIHNLIKSKRFTEAHQSLLSTRQEILRDLEENCHKNPSNDLHKKKTDIKLLYEALRDEMMSIIRDSNSEQSCNTELLVSVVRIIQEEEKREKDPGSGEWSWRDTWKEAVLEGVKAKIKSVHLDSKEQNKSWLAVHLGQLGRVVVEDLENVKNRLTGCYPPSFDVFNTYVDSYHQAIAQHIRDISQKELETKDSYALLKWILNDYKSEKLMGSPTLQPEMNDNIVALPLEEDFLDRIKDYYYCQIRKDFMSIIAKLIETEQGIIHNQMEPEILLDVYHSDIHCHICQALYSEISTAQEINAELEENVLCICLEELQTFPERLTKAFEGWCTTIADSSLRAKYRVAYVNSLFSIIDHLETYRPINPEQVTKTVLKIDAYVPKLGQGLMDQFKAETEPYFKTLMMGRWLTDNEPFQQIVSRTVELSKLCSLMKPSYRQTFVNEVHFHVVKRYICQLMKRRCSCRQRDHKRAAAKLREQWDELHEIFTEMSSSMNWLYPAGEHLAIIIANEKLKHIKDALQALVTDYPDISRKHVSAVLDFHGKMNWLQKRAILNHLDLLKQRTVDAENQQQTLFSEIHVPRIRWFSC